MASPGKKSFLLRVDPALWAEVERLAAFLDKVKEGKKNRLNLGSFLSDRRVASRRRYLFGLCTLKCSLR